ncbi:hypothetical protein NSK_004671 [Nannochloropsis salina CCMP1776]|uniref:Septum formation protein Maf n=1 Tax=Nannochloropsis salina CCMP1776 TaxID=1027361 RepID=A0A4D9D290_9STRA|nr:hypothetical protein NSK_004671 [Nannochloropsis salina CCMP1776]|eukprot:TFJ83565.1 hypothetical protein NSK_004671 [Nannochloropsis salina CCMP1776]
MSAAAPSRTSSTLLPYLSIFKTKVNLVLASKSPRRQEILQLMGFDSKDFVVLPSDFPEDLDKRNFINPADYAQKNAECKAQEVATKLFGGSDSVDARKVGGQRDAGKKTTIVIGSDTIVDRDGIILEKPEDAQHAYAMLSSLSGRTHLVHSGVAIYSSKGPKSGDGIPLPVVSFCETSRVDFAPLSDEEIWNYIRSGEPMDKAGGYGIQGLGGQAVRGIEGCYFTVMGMPMHKLSVALAQFAEDDQI